MPPTDEQSAQDNDNAPRIAPEMASLVSTLTASLQGVQGSLGTAYDALARNMQQGLEMAKCMSDMTEMLLLSNMMITAKIERNTSSPGHSREKPLLRISTENRGRIPIQGLKGVLRIGIAKDGEDGIDASMDCGGTILTSSTTTLVRGKQEVKKTAPVLYVTGKSSAPSELLTLPPETKWEHVLELELAGFDDWHIELVAEFMNVGSARPLTRKLDCCVYLLDQCTIHWLREQSRTPNELACFQANMRTANVRQVLHVPATEGISTGSGFSLTPTADELIIHGRVENITDDGTGATIAVWCEYSSAIDNMEDFVPTEQLLQVVASRVTEELAVLDEMLAETK